MNNQQLEYLNRLLPDDGVPDENINRPWTAFGYVMDYKEDRIAIATDGIRVHVCTDPPEHPVMVGEFALLPSKRLFNPQYTPYPAFIDALERLDKDVRGQHTHEVVMEGVDLRRRIEFLESLDYFAWLFSDGGEVYLTDPKHDIVLRVGQVVGDDGPFMLAIRPQFMADALGVQTHLYIKDTSEDGCDVFLFTTQDNCYAWLMPVNSVVKPTIDLNPFTLIKEMFPND